MIRLVHKWSIMLVTLWHLENWTWTVSPFMHECTVDDVHACHVDLGADCAVRVCVWWLLAGWLAGVFLPDTASHLCIHVWRGWRRRLCFRQGALESSLGNMLQCPVDTAHTHTWQHTWCHMTHHA